MTIRLLSAMKLCADFQFRALEDASFGLVIFKFEQAELAALMYKKSRLVRVRGADGRSTFGADGEAEVVSARG